MRKNSIWSVFERLMQHEAKAIVLRPYLSAIISLLLERVSALSGLKGF